MKKHDIIGDIHGDAERLYAILSDLGYLRGPDNLWFPPKGVKAIFLGDLIDNGSDNQEVLTVVRRMVEAGYAECLMGNHELNAILFHTEGPGGRPLRDRNAKNRGQHNSFIAEFGEGTPEAMHWVRWFMTLPLLIEKDDFRAAHAYWSDDHVAAILERRPDARLRPEDLPEIAAQKGAFADAVLDMLKGPELALLPGDGFSDHYGHWRTEGRFRWWGGTPETWRDALATMNDENAILTEGPFSCATAPRSYDPEAKPLFIGHYKRKGEVCPEADNVLCVDYPERRLVYRADGVIRPDIDLSLLMDLTPLEEENLCEP